MRQRLRKLLLIGAISLAMLAGSPMRPEEIEELLHQASQPKLVQVLREEDTDESNSKAADRIR